MDEQLERFREFMVRQQAQSSERMLQLEDMLVRFVQATRDRFVENERRTAEHDRRIAEHDRRIAEHERRSQEWDEKMAALTDAQIRSEDMMAEMKREARERDENFDRKFAALVDAQVRTEETVKKAGERIDKLSATVDRHIADGHGGAARPEG